MQKMVGKMQKKRIRETTRNVSNLDGPIRANRFADSRERIDSRESPDSRESFHGSRTEPLFLRIALPGAKICESQVLRQFARIASTLGKFRAEISLGGFGSKSCLENRGFFGGYFGGFFLLVFPTLIFLSLLFLKKQGKPPKKARIFSLC